MEQKKDDSNSGAMEGELSAAYRFPVSFAIFAMARSHRGLAVQMLREVGLFAGQEIMLMQLWDKDGQSQNSLARTMRLDHSTVAKSVRRMEDAGFVRRSRSQEDGRVTIVSLTEAGRNLESKVLDIWSKLENITTEGLTEQENEWLVRLSEKIASNTDKTMK